MSSMSIRVAEKAESERILNLITLAFTADPTARWLYPDAHDFIKFGPELNSRFGGRAFEHGTAFVAEDYAGAALWLPPGIHPDEEGLVEHIEKTIPASRHEEVVGVFEEMDAFHPAEPHYYLPLIGVDPFSQGRGIGTKLMKYSLEQFEVQGGPIYLESSNPHNIPFYERLGFAALGRINAGDKAVLTPMVRA